MENTNAIVKISVRTLVEFILRSGDLDNRRGSRAERDAMQAGSRLHRKIQRRMGGDYRAEVPLKYEIPMEGTLCVLEGRADGIFTEEGLTTVDEIKGVYRDLDKIGEPVGVHLAQAMCYAWIYAEQNGLERIGVRMTYGNLETEQLKYFRFQYDRKELQIWFANLMEEYGKWAGFQAWWRETLQKSIRPLQFPFPYREGQRELAAGDRKSVV